MIRIVEVGPRDGLQNETATVPTNINTAFVDASVGGLGGCHFAPGATGNVATKAVVEALRARGETIGADIEKLRRARSILNSC